MTYIPPAVQATELATRTKKNLEYIKQAKKNNPKTDVEEVTQLINSMLGMLIIPKEKMPDLESLDWENVAEWNTKPIRIDGQRSSNTMRLLQPSTTFGSVIYRLRNAFAHNNFRFTGDKYITGVEVWNHQEGETYKHKSTRTWNALITKEDSESFVYLLLDYLIAYRPETNTSCSLE